MTKPMPKTLRAGLLAVLLGGTALGSAALWSSDTARAQAAAANAPSTHAKAIRPQGLANPLPDFADLAAQVSPAVVSVTVRGPAEPEERMEGAIPGFPMPGIPMPGQRGRNQLREARGSGFIIDADGIVVTNNHVVKTAQKITVTLSDGTELPARLLGRDDRTDLAVLKVEAGKPLPSLDFSDSDSVRPGQWVLAVGNPFGLGGTVTAGIVSARGRDIGAGPYDSFLQVDAAINQGNSGGPLFTQDGRVVGVNTAIISPTGGSVGIGFAIPSNLVRTVTAQLREHGTVTRGFLGVETQAVNEAIATGLGLPAGTTGALVANVATGSPAARAGLQPGDVLLKVDGAKVATPKDLAQKVADIAPGHTSELEILRDGAGKTLQVKLAAMPEERQTAQAGQDGKRQGTIGVALAPLSPELRDRLELPAEQKGVVIANVQPGSAADQAGLKQGDLVVGVGNKPVATPSEAVTAIRAGTKDGKAVALRILREGQSRFVAVAPQAAG